MTDTIFARSSGAPPAAIAIIRISGPAAARTLETLAGSLPPPRNAVLRTLRDGAAVLDRALVLWFPGPRSATGEDCAELHCHGGRAVVAAIERALSSMQGLRPAHSGEFTRRAFTNGVLDLAEAEALGDLLASETELQRQVALAGMGAGPGTGLGLTDQIERWRERALELSAMVEAVLDFGDDEDAADLPPGFCEYIESFGNELREWVERPSVERLRDGVRVVLAGPPNSGKSSLFNVLIRDSAAIVSPQAGTTRDAIERPVALDGVPLVLVDTAGLRADSQDAIERVGIERAQQQLSRADIVLWLGREGGGPAGAWEIAARADADDHRAKIGADHTVSVVTGLGIGDLEGAVATAARRLLPRPDRGALNARQRDAILGALVALNRIAQGRDLLLVAEELREVRLAFDRLSGRATTEDMLDALFGRFCIGK